jgi:hypothetical protein
MWLPANARMRHKANQRQNFDAGCLGRTARELYRLKRMNTRKPIEVCITIDTEFSIGGNFDDPALTPVAEPMVLGSVGGKEQGLGFLLDSFAEFGVRATFFVETLQTAFLATSRWGGRPPDRGCRTFGVGAAADIAVAYKTTRATRSQRICLNSRYIAPSGFRATPAPGV